MAGSIWRGMPKIFSSSSSQSSVRRSISIVRLALVTSVTCAPPSRPPVRFQITQVSMLPNTASPRAAASRTPSTLSRIHWILAPEKYVAGGRPVRRPDQRRRRAVERGDDPIGARVLPDDGVVPGAAGLRIPDDGRFALVGDADRRQVRGRQPAGLQRAGNRLVRARGDLQRIVLDPPGPRQNLIVFHLMPRDFLPSLSNTMKRVLVVP